MTYDPKRNILFLHIPKNAGKSVEAMLGMVEPEELEHYRFRSLPSRAGTLLQRRFADKQARRRLFGTIDCTFCAQHLTLQEIHFLGLISSDRLESALTVAVCRNPWDRAVSSYFHFRQPGNGEASADGFKAFWKAWLRDEPADHNVRAHRRRQVEFLRRPDGGVAIDELLRFEQLSEDVQRLRDRGVELKTLPKIGASSGRSRDYQQYYDDESHQLISDYFAEDIEAFGYHFDERAAVPHR